MIEAVTFTTKFKNTKNRHFFKQKLHKIKKINSNLVLDGHLRRQIDTFTK